MSTRIATVHVGARLELPCGCVGRRSGARLGLISVSVASTCTVHDIAAHQGLWVAPTTPVRLTMDDPPLRLGLHLVRHAERPRVILEGAADGITLAMGLALVRERMMDGTWQMGTLVDATAIMPSPADAWLLAEYVASVTHHHGPRCPVALVAADDAQLTIASAYERYSARPGPRTFRARDEATAWLDAQGF